jgi:adenylate kinase
LTDGLLERRGASLDRVFLLEAPRELLIQRLTGRRICRQCGQNYHVINVPPRQEGVCDLCGGALYQRSDDNEETIANRLDVFEKQTCSLIDRYAKCGVLQRVNSAQAAEGLVADIRTALGGGASA